MFRTLKTISGVLLLVLVAVGCASSERMTRMSGDVFSPYSAPKEQRIRSKKYSSIRANSSDTRYSKNQAGKDGQRLTLHENLVNLWPFYFRSGDYTSVFWPLIDNDKYGFAFRPFYNHEGDEYSILFPLSAWNVENKDGWVLNAVWDKDSFTFFPLIFTGKDYSLVLPLWYHSTEKEKDETVEGTTFFLPFYIGHWNHRLGMQPLYDNFSIYEPHYNLGEDFNFVLLGYYGKDTYKNLKEFHRLFRYGGGNDRKRREYLANLFGATPIQLPRTREEINALYWRVLAQIQPEEDVYYGFFPIFMRKSGAENSWTALLGSLYFNKNYNYGRNRGASLLWGLLYERESETNDIDSPRTHSVLNRNSFSLLSGLLVDYEREERYSGEDAALQKLGYIEDLCWDIPGNNIRIADAWKEVDPQLRVPESAYRSSESMRNFLNEYMVGHDYPTYQYRNFFSPLFARKSGENDSSGAIPLLLTFWESDRKADTSECSIYPLLTFMEHSPDESSEDILAGLVWHSRGTRYPDAYCDIYDRDVYFSDDTDDLVYENNGRAFIFGYYKSDNAFLVAKEGYAADVLNRFRKDLRDFSEYRYDYENELQNYNSRMAHAGALVPRTKVERLEKELELARLEEIQARLQDRFGKLSVKFNQLCKSAAGNHIDISLPTDPMAPFDESALIEELIGKYTEERHYKDSGSSILWNRETSEDGASRWKILYNLIAGGSKIGDSEHTHVLHFLYRYTKEGQRSEKLVFPFWSEQRDGENSTESFMWRLWRRTKKDGKTGGYIFFIPYGDVH